MFNVGGYAVLLKERKIKIIERLKNMCTFVSKDFNIDLTE